MKPNATRRSAWQWAVFAVLFSAALFSLYWNTFVFLPKLRSHGDLFYGNAYLAPDYGERVRRAAAFHPEIHSDVFMMNAYTGLHNAMLERPTMLRQDVRTTLDSWDPYLPENPYVIVWPAKIYSLLWFSSRSDYDYQAALFYYEKALSLMDGYWVALYNLHALYSLAGDPRAQEVEAKIESLWGPIQEEHRGKFF